MKQLALDIGLARAPSLSSFLAGPNEAAWRHLQLWAGSPTAQVQATIRMPESDSSARLKKPRIAAESSTSITRYGPAPASSVRRAAGAGITASRSGPAWTG